MNAPQMIKSEFIASCGMNCAICMARLLREKNICPGCRGDNALKPAYCARCIIANCEYLQTSKSKYCSKKCRRYPCLRLKSLDKRYRTKYHMSMIENLEYIERSGIMSFIKNEKARWTCKECDGLICVHRGFCSICKKIK